MCRGGVIQSARQTIHFRGRVGWRGRLSAFVMAAHFFGMADGFRPLWEKAGDGLFCGFLVRGVVVTECSFDRAFRRRAIKQVRARREAEVKQQPEFKARRRMRQLHLFRCGQLLDLIPNVIPHSHIGVHNRPNMVKFLRLVVCQHTFPGFALLLLRLPLRREDDVLRISMVAGQDFDVDDRKLKVAAYQIEVNRLSHRAFGNYQKRITRLCQSGCCHRAAFAVEACCLAFKPPIRESHGQSSFMRRLFRLGEGFMRLERPQQALWNERHCAVAA